MKDKNGATVPLYEHAVMCARLALRFGEVERATWHPDNRPETDTTHTVMLQLLAPRAALAEGLDPVRAVLFALVHDLPEAYAGDVCTARGLSDAARRAKEVREAAAVARLSRELGADSFIVDLLTRYERQDEPEARLVRYLDKVLPKLTHLLNDCRALAAIDMGPADFAKSHARQGAALKRQYPELTATRRLFDAACRAVENLSGGQ